MKQNRVYEIAVMAAAILAVAHLCRAHPDLPPVHYRTSRIVSVWLPYWTDMNGSGAGWQSVQGHAQDIDEVSFFSWGVDPETGILHPPVRGIEPDPLLAQIVWLHSRDIAALFTVTQFGHVHEILHNQQALSKLVDEIAQTAQRNDFDGVDIDFEEFKPEDPEDSALYTSFLQKVAEAMHAQTDANGYPKLAIATVLPKTQRGKFGFTDEEAIAKSDIDRVRVMAYDDNSPGSKIADACAPLPWTKNVAACISQLNCPREKFILGIPGYGYQWPVTSVSDRTTSGKGTSITYPQAQTLINTQHAKTFWDDRSQTTEIVYTKPDTDQVWLGFFEDARSWGAKLDQAVLPSPCGGICEWAVGYEDPASWAAIEKRFATPYPIYGAIGLCYARFGAGQVFGAPLGPAAPWGEPNETLPLDHEGIEQLFEHGRITYLWGDPSATWVKE